MTEGADHRAHAREQVGHDRRETQVEAVGLPQRRRGDVVDPLHELVKVAAVSLGREQHEPDSDRRDEADQRQRPQPAIKGGGARRHRQGMLRPPGASTQRYHRPSSARASRHPVSRPPTRGLRVPTETDRPAADTHQPLVAVVIPALNEEGKIGRVARRAIT